MSPFAWPYRWRDLPGYPALFDRLCTAHGPERTAAIVQGRDAATNADLLAWRGIGRRG